MNIRIVGNYLGKILLLDSICMLPALAIAAFRSEFSPLLAFLGTIIFQSLLGFLLFRLRVTDKRLYAREGLVIVTLSWILISLMGAIPMCLSGAIPSYLDALFETVSGFTTTGATVVGNVEVLPMSILYWRSFTHWLGGMGVLVFLLALLPSSRGSGMPLHILRAESPGPTVGKLMPRLYSSARILYVMYFVLTVLQVVFLLIGKMPFFDALTTAFGTAGTGGFSIKNDSIASYSLYCQTVTSVFMMLFGINFSMYFLILLRDFRGIWRNTELRVYLSLIAISTLLIAAALRLSESIGSFGLSLHHAFFQVSSIITTTGFSTVDFNLWPEFTHSILMILMMVGACAGSTGGGMKVSRVILMMKSLRVEIRKLLHPRSVSVVMMDGKPLEVGTSERCFAFFFLYALLISLSTLLLSLDGFGFKTSFSATLATLNNIGPGMERIGPMDNFSVFSPFAKVILIFNMLLGRLEIFPLVITLLPSTWRRRGF